MRSQMGSAYLITATGTDAGKTFVTAGLARLWRARGMHVRALKPVLSGYDESMAEQSDAGQLLAACDLVVSAANVAAVSPWRFAAPLAPDRAAALEDRAIVFDELVGWCRAQLACNDDCMLIEGIGGVMVPLDAQHTVRDWIAALGVPVLLVAGTYLGALSHTLTALAALREVGVVPAALVANASADSSVSVVETLASLASHVGGLPILGLGRDGQLDAVAEFLRTRT